MRGDGCSSRALRILGGSSVLREVAHCWVRDDTTGEVVSLLQSLGSASEVLRFVAEAAAKFSPVVRMEPVEVHEGSGVVTSELVPGFERYVELCDYTAGLLSIGPMLFGLDAALVEEEQCQLRGDDRCVYRVTWDGTCSDETTEEFLRSELAALTKRFDNFKATASELVSGDDVETLLGKITARAATAVRAQAYLLVVRLSADSPLQIHHQGVAPADLEPLVSEILARRTRRSGRFAADRRRPLRLRRGTASWLHSSHPAPASSPRSAPCSCPTPSSRPPRSMPPWHWRPPSASRRPPRRSWRCPTSSPGCAPLRRPHQRLVDATRGVVSCDHASVWLVDEATSTVQTVGTSGYPAEVDEFLRGLVISVDDTPELPRMLARREPVVVEPATADPYLRWLLDAIGAKAAMAVPLVGHDRVYGFLTVGRHREARTPHVRSRSRRTDARADGPGRLCAAQRRTGRAHPAPGAARRPHGPAQPGAAGGSRRPGAAATSPSIRWGVPPLHRPRSVQGHQRHAGPRGRRCGHLPGGGSPLGVPPVGRHVGPPRR